ncbi:MAG: glycosyltransferase family 2 protein [Mariniphaga sp.]|nr:glycosyltransferase family 2 protein [Mariniphaga sp.]
MKQKVVIITINYRQNEYTLDCIKSLLKSDYPNFQILLIDNGSEKEKAVELEEGLPKDERIILHTITENLGYVGGVNYGLKEGMKFVPDYFMIMNNDTIIDEHAISELVSSCHLNDNNVLVTGKVCDYSEPDRIQDIGYVFVDKKMLLYKQIGVGEIDIGQHEVEIERDMIDDIFWLFHVNLYKSIGGYSDYYWFNGEQADFVLRAKKLSYRLIYTPNAKLLHKGSASLGGRNMNAAQVYWAIQSSLILRFLHLAKKDFIRYYFLTISNIVSTFIKSLFLMLKGINRFEYTYAKFRGLMYFNGWMINRQKNNGKNPFIKQ